jgi:MoaA/NifB/PqqE/SkfB family radical SAM enzyme
MLSNRYALWHIPLFAVKYAWLRARNRPVLVNFEVTMRCNARCGFCDYWKTPASDKARELASFADAARYFSPMMINFTGGEPLLRRDLEDIVAAVDAATRVKYLVLLTHGGMLSVERAVALRGAGITGFNISLDYLDGRHDTARGIPGLTDRIFRTIEGMRTAGIDSVRFNTVIRNDNLDQLLPIVERAESLGCGVNFSLYTDNKNGNPRWLIGEAEREALDETIAALLAHKRRRRGVITNSEHYLRTIPLYVRGQLAGPCESGMSTIHVDPAGFVKRCPDFPVDFHWRDFRTYRPIDCDACYYACRGEAQAPLTVARVRDMMA